MNFVIPEEVKEIGNKLIREKYQAYLVGGCVRDLLLGGGPKDWDVATDAKPEEIQKIFPDSVYENKFGTVGIKTQKSKFSAKGGSPPDGRAGVSGGKIEENLEKAEIVETTTFRLDGRYSDKRHPDEVMFAETIEEDLARRDFTVNAMALSLTFDNKQLTINKGGQVSKVKYQGLLIDPFGGQNDLKKKIIRTVGNPEERFKEDALRLMRAVRFSVQLDFSLEKETAVAVKANAKLLREIAEERIRDEFEKIILTPRARDGVEKLNELGLLQYIIPELCEGIGCKQNKHHVYTVFEHNARALEYAAKRGYSFEVRLASLLHDVGKPRAKRGEGSECTFYNHEMIGAKMAQKILERLHFSNEVVEKVRHLVRYHMFYYNVGEVSESGVRRFLVRVGPESIGDILKVREADRIGSKVPKAFPYKLRHLLFMIEKVKHDPLHPKMLAVKGDDVMKILEIPPGPKVGQILFMLLEEVLDEPKKNERGYLEGRVKEFGKLSDAELTKRANAARKKKEEIEADIEEGMKKKYYVG